MNEQVLPVRSVTFKEAIILFFSQYATFSGRATRKEYWFPSSAFYVPCSHGAP